MKSKLLRKSKRIAGRMCQRGSSSPGVQMGDIVIIGDEGGQW
jgi:hypothetical protein